MAVTTLGDRRAPAGRRARRLGWSSWALLSVPVVVMVAGSWAYRWVSDDGFIHLRVVQQIVAGNGPVFNAGQRVEASTSPLWVALLTVADLVTPIRLEWLAVVLGIGLTVAGLVAAMAGSRVLATGGGHGRRGPLLVPAGALVVVSVSPFWTWASGGLEGGMVLAWLGLCLWALARWARGGRRLGWGWAVVVGLGPLIRPDLGLFMLLFLAVVVAAGRGAGWRGAVRTVALALALPAAYQVFRMGYYGVPVPNPAVTKEASSAWWDQGWFYLRDFVGPYRLWLPLALLALGAYLPMVRALGAEGRGRDLLVVGAFALGGMVHATYIVSVGGDFMYARLLLPGLFALLAPVMVVPLKRSYAGALLVVPWALASLLLFRAAAAEPVAFGSKVRTPVTVQDLGWGPGQPQRAWFTGQPVYFERTAVPAPPPADQRRPVVAAYGIGIVSYALGPDVDVLDMLGLADPFTAHLEVRHRGLVPGHQKPLPAPWVAARLTRAGSDVPESYFTGRLTLGVTPIDDPQGMPFAERVGLARLALDCPAVADLRASYRAPLTLGRFGDNVVGSLRRWALRIPAEPRDAYLRLCSAGSG